MRETSANEPLTTHRNRTQTTSKPECPACSGAAWKGPTYWPCDVRCIGGVTLIRAFIRNLRTWSVMLGRRPKRKPREADSTDAPSRGGLLRSSDETG